MIALLAAAAALAPAALAQVAAPPVASSASPPAAPTACSPDPSRDVELAVDAMEESFRNIDEAAFDRASKALNAAISCLDRPPTPTLTVEIHQALALASFVNGQIRACKRSLAAARLLDPAWKLDDVLFPPTHPYRDLFAAATDPGPVENIGRITPDVWVVDGVVREEAPTERAFLLQVSEEGRVTWSGYLWDFEEIPDRGQARERSVLESPHQWWAGLRLHGGALFAEQADVPRDAPAWEPASGSTFAGGADVVLRYTPITVIGVELTGTMVGPGDPVQGGGGLPSGRGVVLLGGAGWTGGVQPHAAARIGFGLDRMRAWTAAPEGSVPQIWTVPSLVTGVEAGVRANRQRIQGAFEAQVAREWTPYAWQAQVDGGAIVTGPLALEALLQVRRGALPFEDRNGAPVGRRRDTELRIGGGVALWY